MLPQKMPPRKLSLEKVAEKNLERINPLQKSQNETYILYNCSYFAVVCFDFWNQKFSTTNVNWNNDLLKNTSLPQYFNLKFGKIPEGLILVVFVVTLKI